MRVLKYLAVPAIFLAVGLTVSIVFSSLEPNRGSVENYGSKAEAIAANFK